jgi:hypothetical protein
MTVIMVFLLLLLFYYILVNTRNKYSYFFVGVIICIVIYYWQNYQSMRGQVTSNMTKYLDSLERRSTARIELSSPVYGAYRTPRKFQYLRKFPEIMQWLHEMRYFDTYDETATLILAALLERFFMIHYKVVMQKYEASLYTSQLIDIRNDIVNFMYAMIHKFPSHSTIIDKDMDAYHYKLTLRIQSMLTDYISRLEKVLKQNVVNYNEKDVWPKAYERRSTGTYDVL